MGTPIRHLLHRFWLAFTAVILIGLIGFQPASPVNASPSAATDLHAYPVVPVIRGAVYSRVRFYVMRGKRSGLHQHTFTKIGDSITAWNFFLTNIGMGQVQLGGYGDLAETVGAFSAQPMRVGNSFTNISLAAYGGWTSGDLLDPAKADPSTCTAGESPLTCELRVSQPQVALIMVGTNDLVSGDIVTFRNNLNRIVTIVEKHNVVPVISTIPYRRDDPTLQERVIPFNTAIVRIATAHSAPLWNYWLAMEGLPANGVSNDGIHPSLPSDSNPFIFDDSHIAFGFTIRNLTALQVLKQLLPLLR
jgi:hypothetical protein